MVGDHSHLHPRPVPPACSSMYDWIEGSSRTLPDPAPGLFLGAEATSNLPPLVDRLACGEECWSVDRSARDGWVLPTYNRESNRPVSTRSLPLPAETASITLPGEMP